LWSAGDGVWVRGWAIPYQNSAADRNSEDAVKPDALQRAFYGLAFKTAFLDKRGTAFQDWFVKIAGYAYGPDFEEVKAYGPHGDHKCDGLRRSAGMLFQVYAPDRYEDKKTIEKISTDFLGAVEHWPSVLQAWTFVHNDRNGLPPTVTQFLTQLGANHPTITITPWSETELRDLVLELELHQLEDLFGFAPSLPVLDNVGFEQLQPVISAIKRRKPDPDARLTPPSEDKIKHNKLSVDAADLLRMGRRKEARVQDFVDKMVRPDVAEEIAEAVRDRYRSLKNLGLESDEIFAYLQKFVGVHGEPPRQAATLAVMCYFFERCDIFEDMPLSETI
jgi:hypothetical protein